MNVKVSGLRGNPEAPPPSAKLFWKFTTTAGGRGFRGRGPGLMAVADRPRRSALSIAYCLYKFSLQNQPNSLLSNLTQIAAENYFLFTHYTN